MGMRGASAFGALVFASFSVSAANFPSTAVPLPPNWPGPEFALSQAYPAQPPNESAPWMALDPRKSPNAYMGAVLKYCLEGNVQVDWRVQDNTVRRWYHAPWMHWGGHGREPIHGLTMERTSAAGELAPNQPAGIQNWAVGMYNARAAAAIGAVWQDPVSPNKAAAHFPPGSVGVKLLFTEATPEQVPYLAGSKVWPAYIYQDVNNAKSGAPRVVKQLRLLQVDIAVRDPRFNSTTGWIFGTFIYDGGRPGNNPYSKLRPVGLMWGNDQGIGPNEIQHGAKIQQSKLNPAERPIMHHYGWLNRLNGPVDNPKSSCLSCHSVAQWPVSADMTPTKFPEGSPEWMKWFRNIRAGEPFTAGDAALDYSLQLTFGLQNLADWTNTCAKNPNAPVVPSCPPPGAAVNAVLDSVRQNGPIPLGSPVSRQ
jgi:hypothetical protein